MNDETKKQINAKYERELQKGERFWPDSIYKDVVMAFALFVILILLATFIGVHDSPKADPSDTSYVPRPEWYFLFLFKFLALYGQIPMLGKIEWIATVLIPGIAIGLLTLLPFIDKTPSRYYAKRAVPIAIMFIMVLGFVMLTWIADVPTVSADGSSLLGTLQSIAGLIIPALAYIAFIAIAYTLKDRAVHWIIWTASIAAILMIGFTAATLILAPVKEASAEEVYSTLTDQIAAGQDLYSVHCVECHGDDGAVTVIEGVEGLEGKAVMPINGKDVLYTLNDASMSEVIAYGRPDAGMNPFGKAYNPAGLTKSQIDYIVIFMRYTWDDRFEAPPMKPLYPALADGEVPSYDVHIAPIVKRYCISCHREGKENNNYLMTTYDEIINTGDNAPNLVAGDMESIFIKVIQHTEILDDNNEVMIGVMPPKSQLKPNVIDVFIQWIMNGMPQTAEDAAALFAAPTP
jgi:mono/diheme cytochrome c family protein